jgi:hypothetical protein
MLESSNGTWLRAAVKKLAADERMAASARWPVEWKRGNWRREKSAEQSQFDTAISQWKLSS